MSENTKIKISDGLIRLIEKENGNRITVTSLIKACGISRQTFYYHFKDMDDVLEWSAARVTDELVRAGRDTADMRSGGKSYGYGHAAVLLCIRAFRDHDGILRTAT